MVVEGGEVVWGGRGREVGGGHRERLGGGGGLLLYRMHEIKALSYALPLAVPIYKVLNMDLTYATFA